MSTIFLVYFAAILAAAFVAVKTESFINGLVVAVIAIYSATTYLS